jgi:hypothetical protein
MPTVNQTDGQGNMTPHGVIYGIPCPRCQSGANVIINDPNVGDYGILLVADRDISSVKKNAGAQSNPGSYRRHDLADDLMRGLARTAVRVLDPVALGHLPEPRQQSPQPELRL